MKITEKYRVANNIKNYKTNDPVFDNYMALLQAIFGDETPTLTHLLDKDEADRRMNYLEENYYKKKKKPPLAKWWDDIKEEKENAKTNKRKKYKAETPVIVKDLVTSKEKEYKTRKEVCEIYKIDLISLNYYIRYGLCKDQKYMFIDLKCLSNKSEYHKTDVTVENLDTGQEYTFINLKRACVELNLSYRYLTRKRYENPNMTEIIVDNYLFKNMKPVKEKKL